MLSFELGEIVISTAGRDKGKYYLVVDIVDNKNIKLADGDSRKISQEKKKNIKHIKKTGYVAEELSQWLKEAKRVRNEDLKSIISDYAKNKEA